MAVSKSKFYIAVLNELNTRPHGSVYEWSRNQADKIMKGLDPVNRTQFKGLWRFLKINNVDMN